MKSATLLVELLTEELPPKALKGLGESFARSISAALRDRGFLGADTAVTPFATPRRLSVAVTAVAAEVTEPSRAVPLLPVNVAFGSDGAPTEALEKAIKAKAGFARFADVPVERLERRHDGKMERLFYLEPPIKVPLRPALQDALDAAIAALPIPKVMSYAGPGSYFNNEKFVRPAHRLVALHGEAVVPVEALGLSAGRETLGHRFLSHKAIAMANADAYAPTLEAEGKVVPSFAARRASIVVQLEGAAGSATPIMPDALLDEVTALVEWPVVYAGSFDAAFLAVPQECLILTMQLNQRYFALADDSGTLGNRFLLVSNLATHDPSAIVAGNERVLRARLADAKFFFDQDRRQRLEARVGRLASVVHHNKLGSQAQRVDRLRALATRIAPLVGADTALADRAALLAKADLVTDMVGEFPELQGLMGRYYAVHDGEPPEVAAAIEQHYWPKGAGDRLPEAPVAQAVALADRLEALAGMFGIGQVPTGDKDPFGLRRAALGVIRILVERNQPVSLAALVDLAFAAFAGIPAVQPQQAAVLDFVYDRLRGYLREQGYTANQVAAVLDTRPDGIADLPARLAAVQAFAALPEAAALSAANKRIVNILRKSGSEAAGAVDRARLADGAEHDLYLAFQRLTPQVEADYGSGDFTGALKALATAKPAVDRYFDDVMVMADDPAIRANRLALLRGVAATMNRVADISKLA
ncbi:MAG: glycine--tRNA ligase subunit beta [Burkholderiales bacterium]|nr:glycine--tRNA ligase subunit beta [Burkholderiales bacterium]